MSEISRRRLIAGAVVTGAAAALPGSALADGSERGGSRGRRGRGRRRVRRPHGRAPAAPGRPRRSSCSRPATASAAACGTTSSAGGQVSERGATFVGPTQNHMLELARELGVGTFPTYDKGDNVYVADGHRSTYSDRGIDRHRAARPADPRPARDRRSARWTRCRRAFRSRRRGRPPNAAELGRADAGDVGIDSHNPTRRFHQVVPARHAADLRRRAARAVAAVRRCSTSPPRATRATRGRSSATSTRRGGAQMSRFLGGSQEIALRIARQLGGRVHAALAGAADRARARRGAPCISDRATFRARRVIVAIPPTLAGRIDYDPIAARSSATS